MLRKAAASLATLLLAQALAASPGAAQSMPAVPLTPVETAELSPPVVTSHAIAMHGKPKYGPDFEHFDYINPDAPKGGTIRLGAMGTFDSFNPFIVKGTAGAGWAVETLMTSSADEPFTMYGLIAESITYPADRSWATFTLRPEARWHDGEPITVEDVIWSFETLTTKGHPQYRFYYGSVASVEQVGERQVRFTFTEGENRELPLIVGQMPILPKHWFETRNFEESTLEPPLGSGPYRIADFEAGRYIVLERVEDYWGKDLPVHVGQDNFDTQRIDYFRDIGVIREALKAGQIDYFSENSAKDWALSYDVPAVRQGWLIKEKIPDTSAARPQVFFMNTRRPPFDDIRVREAMSYAFDFNWTNDHLYYGQYEQGASYFDPTELAAKGLPSGEELEILEPYRDRLPPEVFTQVFEPPTTDGEGWPRENLLKGLELLREAGWVVRDFKLVNEETGRPFRFEVLIRQQNLDRVLLPYQRNLAKMGIDMNIRFVDTSQYINRLRSFDFDMIIGGIGQSLSPGNEQREYWGSAAADQPGSRNVAGIKDEVVDELIEAVIAAPDRESLVARTRALDRVLLWGYYSVPNLIAPFDRLVYWNKFSRPEELPLQGTSTTYWWWDEAKAEALADWRRSRDFGAGATAGEGWAGRLWYLAGIAALLALGFLLVRRALRRRPA